MEAQGSVKDLYKLPTTTDSWTHQILGLKSPLSTNTYIPPAKALPIYCTYNQPKPFLFTITNYLPPAKTLPIYCNELPTTSQTPSYLL